MPQEGVCSIVASLVAIPQSIIPARLKTKSNGCIQLLVRDLHCWVDMSCFCLSSFKPVLTLITFVDFQREARNHFGCPTLNGMELENQGGPGTTFSHWKKRLVEVSHSINTVDMPSRA